MTSESKNNKGLSPFAQAVVKTIGKYFGKKLPNVHPLPLPQFDDYEPGADGWAHSEFNQGLVHG